ncbi:MAG TPA: hypothetical protein VHN99_08550, partial [Deinococcales bacterium]|nr:hypothetical protein [Deinococcales bacterium]
TAGVWPGSSVKDIGLDDLIDALRVDIRYRAVVRPLVLTMISDERVIRYRQEVLDDLLHVPGLAGNLSALLPRLADLRDYRELQRREGTPLEVTIWRLRELNDCLLLTEAILQALDAAGSHLRAAALLALREQLRDLNADEGYAALRREIPRLMQIAPKLGSVTLGVNLDERLQFSEVTVVGINAERYHGSNFLNRLIGAARGGDPFGGAGPLHGGGSSATDSPEGRLPFFLPLPGLIRPPEPPQARPLMEDLNRLLGPVFMPVNTALTRFSFVSSEVIVHLGPELALLLAVVDLIGRLGAAGLPMCRPEILPPGAREGHASGIYDLTLALRRLEAGTAGGVVTNDLDFDDQGRVLVLTGPNGGGKTTYTRAVGQLQALFQAGLFVPGTRAALSPADAIYTHFPSEEKPGQDQGRLAEEAERLGEIFAAATDRSLVLLNESLASTSPGESLHMARDVVRGLRLLGTRALYNTHLHDLAAGVDALNADTPGESLIASLVSGVEQHSDDPEDAARRTYQVRRGPPLGLSFAREIASRYGISYPKIAERVEARQGGKTPG